MTSPEQMTADDITLLINGASYSGWTEMHVARGIDRCVSDFQIAVTERWALTDSPWVIRPFDYCQVKIGKDVVLTGYVEKYEPSLSAGAHGIRVTGHSKTIDLVQCGMDIMGGQFSGYTLAAIARAVCRPFGIGVVVQSAGANGVVANASQERAETAFAFLERLGRLCGVLLTDDATGNLVLTNAGDTRAKGALVQGENLLEAHAKLDSEKWFSDYICKGQHALGIGGVESWGGAGGIGVPGGAQAPAGTVQTQMRATAHDDRVPRYRPRVTLAESQLTAAQMQQRVNWQKAYAFGQATKLTWHVQGWRQADGSLWQVNQIVPVDSTYMGVDQDLLAAHVTYRLDDRQGRVTEIQLGPVEGYTPDPGQVKIHKSKKGKKKGSGIDWGGAGGV